MWIQDITLSYMLIAIVSSMALFGIHDVASALHKSTDATARCIAQMLWGTCIEITLATVALFVDHSVFLWAGMRIAGRLIELVMIMRFLRYLRSDKT